MTLSDYLQCDSVTLKGMTNEQLLAHFEPYLNVTRPERIERKVTPQSVAQNPEFHKQLAAASKVMGVNMQHLLFKKKR